MAELPIDLEGGLSERLFQIIDVEGKIPRAIEALGPVAGRDVLLLDGIDGVRARQLRDLGARVAFAATVTDAGTVNAAALLDSVTVAPPVLDTVTVHVEFPPDPRLAGAHVSPLTTVAVANEIEAACVLPFNVAVMVAV